MRIRLVRKAEVALVVGPVLRLRQRAKQHRLEEIEIGAVARVDLEQAKIDFVLADEQPKQASQPRPVFAEPLSREDRPRKPRKR